MRLRLTRFLSQTPLVYILLCTVYYLASKSAFAQFVISNGNVVPISNVGQLASNVATPVAPVIASPSPLPNAPIIPTPSVPSPPATSPSAPLIATAASPLAPIQATPVPSATPPSSTPSNTPTNPCNSGVCNVAGRGTCVSMENTGICSAFAGMYLPTKLNAYFAARFPNRNSNLIPVIQNGTTFNDLFGNSPYSFMSNYVDEFGVTEHGCSTPNQRWYITWFCIDILQFYVNNNDPCSSNLKPVICSSTLNSRAESIRNDLTNRQVCLIPPEAKSKGQQYINSLSSFSWASTNNLETSCISGDANENGPNNYKKCGWYSEYAACQNQNSCPAMDATLVSKCPTVLARQANLPSSPSPTPDTTSASLIVAICVTSLGLVCLFIGLRSLSTIRTNANSPKKPTPDVENPPKTQPHLSVVFSEPPVSTFVEDPNAVLSIVDRSSIGSSILLPPEPSLLRSNSVLSFQQLGGESSTRTYSVIGASLPPPTGTSSFSNYVPSPATLQLPDCLSSYVPAPDEQPSSPFSETTSPLTSPLHANIAAQSDFALPLPQRQSPTISASMNAQPTSTSSQEALPSKAQPKSRPPNSRSDLQPVLSPIPD